ncbi:myeloid cell surface antigen CD33-like isoform X2 [Octodon degus]|uniref:Myeloid cell surface antigen CD33-like isoform X2 n=1 Tax=Octodon degus TaxID=10160 RepID=A0A6P6DKQ3_OCTDE|nr:myeloid cell surface antigen CD33-like isoform X2 [Octodon degus]
MLLPLLLLLWMQGEGQWGLGRAERRLPSRCSLDSLSYRLEVPKSVSVQEGQCVLVPCKNPDSRVNSMTVPSYWFEEGADISHDSPVATNDPQRQVQDRTQGRFRLFLKTQPKNCSLHIRDAQKGDSGSYFFRVDSGSVQWSYCADLVSVNVTALTHTPDILIPGTLMPGRPSNLTCSVPWACKQGTPPIFSWRSAALTTLGPRTSHSSVLTLSPRPQDHGTNLTCQVMFPAVGVSVEQTVLLNVSGNHKTKAISGVVQGAIGGAGVTALLAVCLCAIFFIVKTFKKKAPTTAGDTKHGEAATKPGSLAHPPESPAGPPAAPEATPASGEDFELHYASVTFHPRKEPSTEYSTIRPHGRADENAGLSQDS